MWIEAGKNSIYGGLIRRDLPVIQAGNALLDRLGVSLTPLERMRWTLELCPKLWACGRVTRTTPQQEMLDKLWCSQLDPKLMVAQRLFDLGITNGPMSSTLRVIRSKGYFSSVPVIVKKIWKTLGPSNIELSLPMSIKIIELAEDTMPMGLKELCLLAALRVCKIADHAEPISDEWLEQPTRAEKSATLPWWAFQGTAFANAAILKTTQERRQALELSWFYYEILKGKDLGKKEHFKALRKACAAKTGITRKEWLEARKPIRENIRSMMDAV